MNTHLPPFPFARQVIEEDSEDGSVSVARTGEGADSRSLDYDGNDGDDEGTEVDEDYYQESFFPPEESHSESGEEQAGGVPYAWGRDGGGGAVVAASESFQEDDGRADSLV